MLLRSSSLELMEARIAPAGVVKIALSHGPSQSLAMR